MNEKLTPAYKAFYNREKLLTALGIDKTSWATGYEQALIDSAVPELLAALEDLKFQIEKFAEEFGRF